MIKLIEMLAYVLIGLPLEFVAWGQANPWKVAVTVAAACATWLVVNMVKEVRG